MTVLQNLTPGRLRGPRSADDSGQPPSVGRGRFAVHRRVGFWLVALIFSGAMLGTTLPTPLYDIYQTRMHFSSAMVTVTYAVYAASVLVTLLVAGRSSDQAGRKPVLAVALGASVLSTVVFILAPDVATLMVGRIISGLSTGLMTGTATAMLTELSPASGRRRASLVATAANMGGLGFGPLVAGLFAQFAPDPTTLVFEVYLAVLAVAGLAVLAAPETVSTRRRPTLRFTGLGIPTRGRGEFVAATLAGFAAFALLGLFSSVVPGFMADVLHQGSHAVQGAVVFLMFAVGTIVQLTLSRFNSRRVVAAGLGLFLAALALILAGFDLASMPLFLAGTVVAGAAVGAIFLGSMATVNRLAPPEHRGQTISTYFVGCYFGLIIPVIGVGIAAEFIGTFPAVLAFSILLAALCLFSLGRVARVIATGTPEVSQ
jgi:MFS family permease